MAKRILGGSIINRCDIQIFKGSEIKDCSIQYNATVISPEKDRCRVIIALDKSYWISHIQKVCTVNVFALTWEGSTQACNVYLGKKIHVAQKNEISKKRSHTVLTAEEFPTKNVHHHAKMPPT